MVLQPFPLPYGNESISAFKDSETNLVYQSSRIANYVILEFGAISANQTKRLDLGEKGLDRPILLKSIYAFSSETTNDELREFVIYRKDENGNLNQFATQKFSNDEMPYRFPDAILFPINVIEVKPRYDTDNIVAYAVPVNVQAFIKAF